MGFERELQVARALTGPDLDSARSPTVGWKLMNHNNQVTKVTRVER
jgi:hypothetical protein